MAAVELLWTGASLRGATKRFLLSEVLHLTASHLVALGLDITQRVVAGYVYAMLGGAGRHATFLLVNCNQHALRHQRAQQLGGLGFIASSTIAGCATARWVGVVLIVQLLTARRLRLDRVRLARRRSPHSLFHRHVLLSHTQQSTTLQGISLLAAAVETMETFQQAGIASWMGA